MKTLGACLNFFNEADALPGWLESASRWADDIAAYQAGPNGEESDDGSIEILEKWRIPIHRGSINEGFGIVRTAAVRACKTDYVMLLDADERFLHSGQVLTCSGENTSLEVEQQVLQEYDTGEPGQCPANWENLSKLGAKLSVSFGEVYNQAAWVKDFIQHGDLDAVCMIRRHWHDFTFKRPTQNWHTRPDYQIRLVRNRDDVHWDANTKMHETLVPGNRNIYQPNHTHGPFYDHFHCFFKRLSPLKRQFAVRVYRAIHYGHAVPSWKAFKKEYGG